MSGIFLIGDNEFDVLQDLINELLVEADKCASVRAYFAACVLLGAALEAMLLAMVYIFPEEVEKIISTEKFKRKFRNLKDPRFWRLHDLLAISFEMGWIPFKDTEDPDQGELGDWLLNYLKEVRNLIHPGKKIRDYKEVCLTKEHFEFAYDLLDITREHLLSKVEKALAETLGFGVD